MHEWALAEAIVSSVLKAARDAGASRVRAVEIAVGELQGLDEEAIRFALRELSKNTLLQDAVWNFYRVEAGFRCRVCGAEWGLAGAGGGLGPDEAEAVHFLPEVIHAFMRCPSCGSPDFEITRGRGIWVERVEATR